MGWGDNIGQGETGAATGGGSKPPIGGMVGGGIGGAADLLGLITDITGGNQESQAITDTGNNLQSLISALTGQGQAMVGNYNANAVPALNNIIGSNPAAIQGYQAGAAGAYGQEGAYGTELGASPYPGMIQSEGGLFQTLPAGSIAQQGANAAALENWHGLGNKELGQATTVASNAAESAANTMKAQMGGVANEGAALTEGINSAAQAGMQTGSQLGALAQEQELGAKEAAGQEYGQIAGEQLAQAQGTVGATEAAGSAFDQAMTGAGGLMGASGQGLAGLSEQDIQELESALGTEASMAQAGMGAQEYGASDYTSLLEQELGLQNSGGGTASSLGGFASGIMSLLPLFGIAA